MGKNVTEKLIKYKTKSRPKSYVNIQNYMLDNGIYFYDISQPNVTPLRSESSRTEFDEEVRHRGSVLDLMYSSPDKSMIEGRMLTKNTSPDACRLSNQVSDNSEDSMREIALKQRKSMLGRGHSVVVGPSFFLGIEK